MLRCLTCNGAQDYQGISNGLHACRCDRPDVPNHIGEWMCGGCGVWYPKKYIVTNEVTKRRECCGCYLCWQKHDSDTTSEPAHAREGRW